MYVPYTLNVEKNFVSRKTCFYIWWYKTIRQVSKNGNTIFSAMVFSGTRERSVSRYKFFRLRFTEFGQIFYNANRGRGYGFAAMTNETLILKYYPKKKVSKFKIQNKIWLKCLASSWNAVKWFHFWMLYYRLAKYLDQILFNV